MTRLLASYLIVGLSICNGFDVRQLQELYRSILNSDDAHLPNGAELATREMEDSINSLSSADMTALVPNIRECLHSGRVPVVREGIGYLYGVGLRPDGAQFLEPYIDDLVPLLRNQNQSLRKGAVFILGLSSKASQKASQILIKHLADKDTPADELSPTALSLLLSANPAVIHTVLPIVQQKHDPQLTVPVLVQIGYSAIDSEDALQFIRMSLTEDSENVRTAALSTLGRMKPGTRSSFYSELQHIRTNPAETAKIRELAKKTLAQDQ